MATTGTLSVESGNLFGILRSWLYPERDIVFRELVSNAADAIAKRRELDRRAGRTLTDERIELAIDAAARTLTVTDNGIGMTADEVDRYINQIAFSGAAEFVDAYREADPASIIGHFGVGFYAAFMLADRVEIETLSAAEDAAAVHWTCQADMAYTMSPGTRNTPGTEVVLHLDAESPYLGDPDLALAAARRHVGFLPIPVRYTYRAAAGSAADGGAAALVEVPVNDTDPVWRRPVKASPPGELAAFYRAHFVDPLDPLFAVELVSLELGLRGMVFFRGTRGGARDLDGSFDVYSRGVLVGRDVAGLVPKFVGLQSGIVECDDLDLLVSRAGVRGADAPAPAAQDDREARASRMVEAVCEAISQIVTLHLHRMATTDRSLYERYWPEIGPCVKYGVLTDRVFASVMTRWVLFEELTGCWRTIDEYLADAPDRGTVYYTSDREEQAVYCDLYARGGVSALVLDHVIDTALVRRLELVHRGVRLRRLDAGLAALTSAPEPGDEQRLGPLIADLAAAIAPRVPRCAVRVVRLAVPDIAVMFAADEASRRVDDLLDLVGASVGQEFDESTRVTARTLLVNAASDLVTALAAHDEGPRRDLVVHQLVDLALLAVGDLGCSDTPTFCRRSESALAAYLGDG